MSDFLKDIIKETGNEYAGLVSDGIDSADVTSFIDTGSYSFNALLSGTIYGGMPGNKITAIAGEAATGKTFFALGICKHFLDMDKDACVIYFESESAISKDISTTFFLQSIIVFKASNPKKPGTAKSTISASAIHDLKTSLS